MGRTDCFSRLMAALYVILGVPGSGRRDIVDKLIRSHLSGGAVAVYLAEDEVLSSHDACLRSSPETSVSHWRDQGDGLIVSDAMAGDFEWAFFLLNGFRNPLGQMEAVRPWILENGFNLARVMTVLHCRLLYENRPLKKWFDACIHFSDCVLLNMRTGVPNRWIKDFQDHYTRHCYPCLFELVRKGKVPNPERVLFPEARRISHYFDDLEPSGALEEILIEGDLSSEEDKENGAPQDDPYLCRDSRGHRRVRVPEIRKYLSSNPYSGEPSAS